MSHTTTRLKHGSKVYVNVYDLGNNEFLYPFGLGFYHSGIEIDGRGLIQEVLYLTRIEYTYSKSGVFSSTPKEAPPAVFRESIYLGETKLSYREIENVLADLSIEFPGKDYDPIRKNCNHFASAFTQRILNGRTIPSFINRMASFGNMFSCLLPKNNTIGEQQEGGNVKRIQPFSGTGRTLSGKKKAKQQPDEVPLIDKREQILRATMARLNKPSE